MRRAFALLALLALMLPLGVSETLAGQARPLVLGIPARGTMGYGEQQNPIEQQSDWPWLPSQFDCSANTHCVVNPTECRWDVDDNWQVIAVDRYLDPGASASMSPCLIADSATHYVCNWGTCAPWTTSTLRLGVSITANSPGLVVRVSYAPQGHTFALAPVPAGRDFAYTFCGRLAYSASDPALVPIPGSAGGPNSADGTGVLTTTTITVTNPTNKRVRGIAADIQSIGAGASGASCVPNAAGNTDYPFTWTQS